MAEAKTRVLVADGERFFREAIVETLGEAGMMCEAVENGAAVLSRVADLQVGVLILDVAVSDPASSEVLRRVRETRPALRVIALSAQADHELVLDALRQGASDYLAKPLHDEELVMAVGRALAAYDVEARGLRLRARLRSAGVHATALSQAEDDGSDEALAAFAQKAANGVAAVLDAEKTSLMLSDTEGGVLRVAAATGPGRDASAMGPVPLGAGVAGLALSRGEALLVEDVYSDARVSPSEEHERYATPSLTVVPLGSTAAPLGVLCATDRVGGAAFGDDELALLQLMALPVVQFLSRRAVVAAPAGQSRVPDPLIDAEGDGALGSAVCAALVREIEPLAVLEAALEAVSERLGGSSVSLYLIDNRSGRLHREHDRPAGGPGDRRQLPRDRGVTGQVLQGGAAVASAQPERDDAFDPDVDTALDGEGRSLLCVPLRLRGKVVGVLRAFPAADVVEAISPGTTEVLSTALSAAVRNVLLYRSLLESIDELSEARREAGPLRL